MGLAVSANTGKGIYKLYRFTSKKAAEEFVAEYRAPNHCPQAFAEIVKRKEIEGEIKTHNTYGDTIHSWDAVSIDGETVENYEELF